MEGLGPTSRKTSTPDESSPKGPGQTPANGKPTAPVGPTGRRLWLYRLASVVLGPALFLGLVELALRLLSFGDPTSFFITRATTPGGPTLIENRAFGRRFFPPGLERAPLTLALARVKPAGTYRIFVLGESAAQGIPDPSTSFARILDVMLKDRYPEKRFEVINTAMVAINSNVVRAIASECAGLQPDLFIVHLGNNEVVGPYGAAGVIGPFSPNSFLIRTVQLAKCTRTGQLLDSAMRLLGSGTQSPRYWAGMAMFLKSRVRAEDPRLRTTYARFRENLGDICRTGVDAGAEVIVCTVPVNLRDCAPFASLHAPNLTVKQVEAWDRIYRDGVRLEASGQSAEAIRRYHEAARIDDRFAALRFRLARCNAVLGRAGEARREFVAARDLDALRFRSDTTINETVRQVAASRSSQGVHLVDAERDFAANSPDGVPGENLFCEHVHMNFSGNYLIARGLLAKIGEVLTPAAGSGARGDSAPLSERTCADRLAYTGRERYRDAVRIHEMILAPPFTDQIDRDEREGRWERRLGELRAYLGPEALKEAITRSEEALRLAPMDWMIRHHYANLLTDLDNSSRASRQYEEVIRRMPHFAMAHYKLGTLLLKARKFEEANARFRETLALAPDFVGAHYGLAEVLAARGKIKDAIAVYAERVQEEPDRVEALSQMAGFLRRVGKPGRAKTCLEEAVLLDPNDAQVHVDLANALAAEGALDAAIAHYEAASRLRPNWRELSDHLTLARKARDEAKPTRNP